MEYTITRNEKYDSLEVLFSEKPGQTVREALRTLKFRWNAVRGIWYGFAEENALRDVLEGHRAASDVERPKSNEKRAKTEPKEKKNKFDVKVGDIFSSSWGYEQTNVNFYQVRELRGEQSVIVQEVYPSMTNEKTYAHGMAADRTYEIDNTKLLPVKKNSEPMLKRVIKSGYDGELYLNIASYESAYLCKPGKMECYESWYY